jgi:hypothetical protein
MNYHEFTENPIVTISGGEPGLHPYLLDMVTFISGRRILVTNGLAVRRKDINVPLLNNLHEIHIGIDNIPDNEFLNFMQPFPLKIVFQYVLTQQFEWAKLIDIVESLRGKNYVFKIFQDFNAPRSFDSTYRAVLKYMNDNYSDMDIQGRFTGVQVNRGVGCLNCGRRCITLKALWLFPDGTVSPCPQRPEFREKPEGDYMERAKKFHYYQGV